MAISKRERRHIAEIRQLNTCWNSICRRVLNFHRWESVKVLQLMCERLDRTHILNKTKLKFYNRLYRRDSDVLQYCLSISKSCKMLQICSITMTPVWVMRFAQMWYVVSLLIYIVLTVSASCICLSVYLLSLVWSWTHTVLSHYSSFIHHRGRTNNETNKQAEKKRKT